MERKTKWLNNDVRATHTTLDQVYYLMSLLLLYCHCVACMSTAKRAPRLLPAPALTTTMTTANLQLRRPTSQSPVTTKLCKLPQQAYRLRKQNTRSAHSQLWSPHDPPSSTSTTIHSRSTEAPLSNTTMMLKPPKTNMEDNNPNKDKTIFEESIHKNTRWVQVVRGGRENETRRGRWGEGDNLKWQRIITPSTPLG